MARLLLSEFDPAHGTMYTIQEWFANGERLWSEYDGSGYWAITGYESSISVGCGPPAWATHVAWYNK